MIKTIKQIGDEFWFYIGDYRMYKAKLSANFMSTIINNKTKSITIDSNQGELTSLTVSNELDWYGIEKRETYFILK